MIVANARELSPITKQMRWSNRSGVPGVAWAFVSLQSSRMTEQVCTGMLCVCSCMCIWVTYFAQMSSPTLFQVLSLILINDHSFTVNTMVNKYTYGWNKGWYNGYGGCNGEFLVEYGWMRHVLFPRKTSSQLLLVLPPVLFPRTGEQWWKQASAFPS